MTITQIHYVLEIAEQGSISAAAERLYISQSALSQQIARLEKELGYALFLRQGHGLSLTPEGERFREAARQAADAWQRFQESIRLSPGGPRGHLKIGIGARVFSNGLFPRIVAYWDTHPELDISFVTESGRDFCTAVRSKRLDLALDVLPGEDFLKDDPDMLAYPLIRERQCVLVDSENPLAKKKSLKVADLAGLPMISGLENSSEARLLKETLHRHGISFSRIYRSDSIDTVMNLVRAGRGVVLGPRSFAAHFGVKAVPLDPESYASLQFICTKEKTEQAELRDFRLHLQSL